jgi:dipeptidyl-peptidase III
VTFYRTGEPADRVAYDIAWVQDRTRPVDTINGFVEVYMDARGHKGAWEALVYYVNREKTEEIRKMAAARSGSRTACPGIRSTGRPASAGISANAIDVVIETGDSGPVTPVGINLPNDQAIREKYGSKSLALSNVTEAYDRSTPARVPPRVRVVARGGGARRAVGHGGAGELHDQPARGHRPRVGPVADHLKGAPQTALKEQYSALEEARADLVALYFLADPKLVELGILPPPTTRRSSGRVRGLHAQRARAAAPRPRRVADRGRPHAQPPDDRAVADGATPAIEVRRRDGKTYYVMVTRGRSARGSGRLLAEVQRIKAEGDYAAAKALFEAYGVHFDPALRDEVVARVDRLHMPSYTGFVQPRLTPVVAPTARSWTSRSPTRWT